MANKMLFKSVSGKMSPKTDTRNRAGGIAYSLGVKHALAQYAGTGCLNGTFYADAETQLDEVLSLCEKCDPEFIAKTAVYSREKGYMKDLPALLCAVLGTKDGSMLSRVFNRVIDNGKMLRNFVQIIRSGITGRKSLGTLPKRLVLEWLENRSDEQLFRASVGNDPSLADIIRMVHPKPKWETREALFGYLIDGKYDPEKLPFLVQEYEDFKRIALAGGMSESVPDVPFQMLSSLDIGTAQWTQIAKKATWQMTRMNLNTFARHGVFCDKIVTEMIARRLRDPEEIAKAKVFPYQLLSAYINMNEGKEGVPRTVRNALQDAMEIATKNIPRIGGKVYVFPDISGSMHSSVSGYRKGSSSKVECIDVAALIAASILRVNPEAEVIPFENRAVEITLNPRDSVMTNSQILRRLPAGGTNCSAPLQLLNKRKAEGDLLIYVSDNESWVDSPYYGRYGGRTATETMSQWGIFKQRSPNAKMVCIDIQPNATTQVKEREDIINVGGFSDSVFTLISEFVQTGGKDRFVKAIESIEL